MIVFLSVRQVTFTNEHNSLLGILLLFIYLFLQIDKNMLGESGTLQSSKAVKGG